MFPFVYRVVSVASRKLPLPRGKLASSFAGRRAAVDRWIKWASLNRTNRPLVWVHGASVGENLSAAPVVARLRTAIPGLQVVNSYTSPSAIPWHDVFGSCRADFLPPEDQYSTERVLDAIQPDLFVYSRGDLWPVMTRTASAMRIPIAVVGGTVNPSSQRRWPLVRRVLAPTYRLVHWLGAVSRGDAERWLALGVSAQSAEVTGDPRHDHVIERHTSLSSISSLLGWCSKAPVLVAGSTERRDEEVLLKAFARIVRDNNCNTRLVIAPHEITKSRMRFVREVASRNRVSVDVWDGSRPPQSTQCVVVAQMGVLADLYALGQIAYVGGGFGRGGLHAVVEPAAYAIPVVSGPDHSKSRDFGLLLKARGAIALPRRHAEETLRQTWIEWVKDPEIRSATGLRARQTLQQGAAATSATALLRLISPSRSG